MPNAILRRALPHPDDTDRLGSDLSAAVRLVRPEALAFRLEGDLGAGKTSLVRAMLRAWGWSGPVKSPTFALLESYPIDGLEFHHFDFYRFEYPEEFEDAGFREMFGPGRICATEWSERALPYLPPADLTVRLTHEGLGRRAELEAHTDTGAAILAALADAPDLPETR